MSPLARTPPITAHDLISPHTQLTYIPAMTADKIEEIIAAGMQTQVNKYYLIACLVVFTYEHLITFSDEIRFIWWPNKQKISNFIFYLSRYYTLICLSVIVFINFSTRWNDAVSMHIVTDLVGLISTSSCIKLSPIEPVSVMVALIVTDILLLLRVYAYYYGSWLVMIYLGSLIVCQTVVNCVLFTFPGDGPLPVPGIPPISLPTFNGCVFSPSPRFGYWPTAVLALELVYDLSIFSLIIVKTWREVSMNALGHRGLARLIIRDGTLYFVVICPMIFIWAIMNLFAPPVLKELNAIPSSTMLLIMSNRLTLNIHRKARTAYSISDQLQSTHELSTLRWASNAHDIHGESAYHATSL
ncbi:hypothetical protein K439DRAFT_1665716 [Ramaria rubella]|nr:hypothetical protein K439DRAFT_1665716 [Ramaria rubella]